MNGYDPNSDENWLKEYLVGQTTGGGWGTYGEIGNQAYHAQRRLEVEQQKQQRKTRPVSPPVHTSPVADPLIRAQPASSQKSWSTVFALLGFLAGAFALYDPVDSSWGAPVSAGLITGYLAGRFYKALLLTGAVLLALQLYYGAA